MAEAGAVATTAVGRSRSEMSPLTLARQPRHGSRGNSSSSTAPLSEASCGASVGRSAGHQSPAAVLCCRCTPDDAAKWRWMGICQTAVRNGSARLGEESGRWPSPWCRHVARRREASRTATTTALKVGADCSGNRVVAAVVVVAVEAVPASRRPVSSDLHSLLTTVQQNLPLRLRHRHLHPLLLHRLR